MEYLFAVESTFLVPDSGLVLASGLKVKPVKPGDHIRIILPDKSIIETKIKGVLFLEDWAILIEKSLKKEDVPIGSEVWLYD